jgi:hypothetical protein
MMAHVLIQRLIWLGWSWLLISRMRLRLLCSRNLVLELLLLQRRRLYEALGWLEPMLVDHSRIVFRRRLRRIRQRPIIRWRHGIAYILSRRRDKTGLGTWLEASRELPRGERDNRPALVVLLLGVMVCGRRCSSLLATGHRGIGRGVVGRLLGPLLLRGRLLLPLGRLVLRDALREGDGWKSG